jgi:hypothetical protein
MSSSGEHDVAIQGCEGWSVSDFIFWAGQPRERDTAEIMVGYDSEMYCMG